MGNIFLKFCDKKKTSVYFLKESFFSDNVSMKNVFNESSVLMNNFIIKGKLGEGNFSKIFLVENIRNGTNYALKKIAKTRLLDSKNQLKYILNERNILKLIDHPFILKLEFTFNDKKNLYFGFELMRGRDLLYYIRILNFTEEQAIFFTIQILLALNYLHQKLKIIHRNLKPESILIDSDGFIRIKDFKYSTIGIDSTRGICGNIEYMAPEIVQGDI